MMKTLLYVVVTNCVTYFFCRVYYQRLLTRLLKEQREELEAACEERIQELAHYFNHYGPIPPGASLLGLLSLISLAIKKCVRQLTRLFGAKDHNTTTVIEELEGIEGSEVKKAIKLTAEFMDEKRNQIATNFKFKKDELRDRNN